MDEFQTDDERAESAKRWVRDNGLFLVAGVVLGLAVLYGWQFWEENRATRSAQAALIWQQLQGATQGERLNEVEELLTILETDYAATPYLDQSRLAIARMHMDRNAPEEALEALKLIISQGSDASLRRVAVLRAAQIYLYIEQYDEALAVLGPGDETAFVAQYHDIRGDVYFARGEYEAARDEYAAALDQDDFATVDRSFVQMKYDDVTGTIARMANESAAIDDEPGAAGTATE